MQPKKWHIRLDMKKQYDNKIIELIRQDTYSNQFLIHLVNDGVGVNFDNVVVAAIIFDKSDGTQVIGSCEVVRTGLLKYMVDYQALTSLGITTITIKLLNSESVETSTSFVINVIKDPFAGSDGGVTSTSSYPILTQMLTSLSDVSGDIEIVRGWINNPEQLRGPRGPQGVQGPLGPQGIQGIKGPQGTQGPIGKAFMYSDFTNAQLTALKGPQGDRGPIGLRGLPGAVRQSTPPTEYVLWLDHTEPDYPPADVGPQGPPGDPGPTGERGPMGLDGPKGDKGDTGEVTQEEFDGLENEVTQHKLDYTSQRQQDQLKVAKVEKDINDYQSTMASVNVNQEAKQNVSGYGVVSLPKNSANGQVSASVKGQTISQLVKNGNMNGITNWFSHTGVLVALNSVLSFTANSVSPIPVAINTTTTPIQNSRKIFVTMKVKVTNPLCKYFYLSIKGSVGGQLNAPVGTGYILNPAQNTEYVLSHIFDTSLALAGNYSFQVVTAYSDATTANGKVLEIRESMAIDLNTHGLESLTLAQCNERFPHFINGTKSTVSASRLKSVSEDETQESTQYLPNVGELRSLPNGVSDEIKVSGGKAELVKRVSDTMEELAEPIITPIQVSGNLISYPSGTVYVENVVADAGIYTTKFDIKELQLPIKSIDKLIKYNFTTGVQTVLDTSLAVINEDKKSFTHPNLTDKDMVFVDYYYDVESTLGETTIEYLDSRHTIKDSVNNKFYSWNIKSTNGVPTVELTEVL